MRIDNSQQMFQQIDAGANLKVGKDNTLETQSGIGKFFQSVGDAFKNLSATGRASIQARTERLQNAMADMVRQAMPNLADAPPPAQAQGGNAALNLVVSKLVVAENLGQFPKASRPVIAKLAADILRNTGKLEGAPAQVRQAAKECVDKLATKPHLLKTCELMKQNLPPKALEHAKNTVFNDATKTFIEQKHLINHETGLHDSFMKDYMRGSVATVNGQPVVQTEEAAIEMLTTLVPDIKIRSFVTMMASQAGLEGSVIMSLASGEMMSLVGMPNMNEQMSNGAKPSVNAHKYHFSTENGNLNIQLRCTVDYNMFNFEGQGVPENDTIMGSHNYEMTMSIPMNQDMNDKEIPEYTVTQFSMSPSD